MRNILISLCLVLSLFLVRESRLLPDGKLHLHLLDVGQGDSLLLRTPGGANIVVDGGPDLSLLTELTKHVPLTDRQIDLVILTHADADHITALPELLRRYQVTHLLVSGTTTSSGRYDELITIAESHGTTMLLPATNNDLVFSDGVRVDLIWPDANAHRTDLSANNTSVVARVLYGPHRLLLTGDIEDKAEMNILRSGADVSTTVLKVAHHGSITSSSTGFLLATAPEVALISSGQDNPYNHPHQAVVRRFHTLGILTKNTADEGGISLVFTQ